MSHAAIARPPRLARHTLLNLLGQGLPALAGLITVPIMVRGLGTDAFGAFSIAWIVIGYLSLVDLGLGRATTRFVAERLERGEPGRVRGLVGTSLKVQGMLGLGGAVLLILLTPTIVDRALTVPPDLRSDLTSGFYVLAAALPIMLVTANLSGVLEALRRFELLNALRIPASLAILLLPALAVLAGSGFLGAVAALVLARTLGVMAFAVAVHRLLPKSSPELAVEPSRTVRELLAFGGWLTVSNVVSPLMVYADRFIIGARLSLTSVSYYSAPYDVLTRLTLIPSSLVSVLFPEFSRLSVTEGRDQIELLVLRSTRALFALLGTITVVVVPCMALGLQLWLGRDFADQSTAAAQLLTIGVLANSVAWVPLAYLQGAGRPDLPAKAHLMELPIYISLLWFLSGQFGITGVALAWLIRVSLDAILLFGFSVRLGGIAAATLLRATLPGFLLLGLCLVGSLNVVRHWPGALPAMLASSAALLTFLVGAYYLMQQEERAILHRACRHAMSGTRA